LTHVRIVLSASVRRTCLVQSTADRSHHAEPPLDPGRRSHGLDNPTNYFTAAGLDHRAGHQQPSRCIGNGVQVLQRHTGLTSLQKLVDTASRSPTRCCRLHRAIRRRLPLTLPQRRHRTVTRQPQHRQLAGSVITFKTSTATLAVTIARPSRGSALPPSARFDQLNSVLNSNGITPARQCLQRPIR